MVKKFNSISVCFLQRKTFRWSHSWKERDKKCFIRWVGNNPVLFQTQQTHSCFCPAAHDALWFVHSTNSWLRWSLPSKQECRDSTSSARWEATLFHKKHLSKSQIFVSNTCVRVPDQSCSLSTLQARLKVAAHQAEEESEVTAENFLEGRTDIDEFLTSFMEKRTVREQKPLMIVVLNLMIGRKHKPGGMMVWNELMMQVYLTLSALYLIQTANYIILIITQLPTKHQNIQHRSEDLFMTNSLFMKPLTYFFMVGRSWLH